MVHLGVQYYRPPFPDPKYWADDLTRMADSGLNTVQLWVKWAWVEPAPGEFRFNDYDRLVELADANGLGVILSTIAAIHPYWIHRVVPGSEMVDNMGHKVISSNRVECHFGLTPGGCTDHPGVWERMAGFLGEVVRRYRGAANLRGWDAWNELRWNVNADGLVCYCPHTIERFRRWLDELHGGLDGLNKAWKRRYRSWEDVLPGKMARSPYTEMMAFQHFITWRADMHARARYDLMKSLDPGRPVTVHGACPCVLLGGGYPSNTALGRGNDWSFADHIDGVGCSSFPIWERIDPADFTARIGFVAAAARGKRVWLSEVQGGRAASGFTCHEPVEPAAQQRWLWTGIGAGAEAVLFWCWRDEVFGSESAGFGMSGRDGLAQPRLAAMKKTGRVLREHADLLAGYRPDPPEAGIFFSPQSYYLHWTQEGRAATPQQAVQGYARALLRQCIPFAVVEEAHLDALAGLKVLFMPRAIVIDDPAAEALSAFVSAGGTLLCESECGAFGSNGLYRYPEDRFLARLAGVQEAGRRPLAGDFVEVSLDGRRLRLPARQWTTPLESAPGEAWSTCDDGPLVAEVPVGMGRAIVCGAYFGDAYYAGSAGGAAELEGSCGDFEAFLALVARRAGVRPAVEIVDPPAPRPALVHVQTGASNGRAMVFVIRPEGLDVVLRLRNGFFGRKPRDLVGGGEVEMIETPEGQTCRLVQSDWGVAVLAEPTSVA